MIKLMTCKQVLHEKLKLGDTSRSMLLDIESPFGLVININICYALFL